jgi:hypothetical protein
MDYFVPNFVRAQELKDNDVSLNWAENHLGHVWNYKAPEKKKAEEPTQYNYNPELDQDVKDTHAHTQWAEKSLDHQWKWDESLVGSTADMRLKSHPHVQSLAQSDPISGSAGFPERKKKSNEPPEVEYPDPNSMKLEEDIIDNNENLKWTENYLGRQWQWEDDERQAKNWINPVDNFERTARLAQREPSKEPWQRGPDAD